MASCVCVAALMCRLLLQLLHTRKASNGRAVHTGREHYFSTVLLLLHLLLFELLLVVLQKSHCLLSVRSHCAPSLCWDLDLATTRNVWALAIPVDSEGSEDHVADIGINLI
jgi:hypothetical protein